MPANRRQFMKASLAVLLLPSGLKPTAAPAQGSTILSPRTAYRLSLRGRRGSQAAKKHNANHIFATMDAANRHRAHPGDHSRIVSVIVSQQEYVRLFTSRHSQVADLRQFKTAADPVWKLLR